MLENRTCPLDGGGSLISAQRYDTLLATHTRDELHALQLRRCDERFRIVAIGAPVPPYVGAPLDPPLRSRFAARRLDALSTSARTRLAAQLGQAVPSSAAWRCVVALERLCEQQQQQQQQLAPSNATRLVRVPPLPAVAVAPFAALSIARFPAQSPAHLLRRMLPLAALACTDATIVMRAVADVTRVALDDASVAFGYRVVERRRLSSDIDINNNSGGDADRVAFTFRHATTGATTRVSLVGAPSHINRHASMSDAASLAPPSSMIALDAHYDTLAALLADMTCGATPCIVAPSGCGKSLMCRWLALALGFDARIVTVQLFKDVSTRELLMRRATTDVGDSAWVMQPLVRAMLDGSLVVLDGAHRPPPTTLAALCEVIDDRQCSLPNGARVLRHDRYDAMALSHDAMLKRGLFRW